MPDGAFDALRKLALQWRPIAAIVLGSGLNSITDDWPLLHTIPFSGLPGLAAATVAGHKGLLCLHEFAGQSVLVFQGRPHFYEGHSWEAVERPIRLAHELGARRLILTNASGGIGPKQNAGTLMSVRDHIAANRPHWWLLPGPGGIGPTRPAPYSSELRTMVRRVAESVGIELSEGIYACVTGPLYETPAEVRALKAIGADAVGMSTVHEAETAAALGMEVAAISCVANRAAGISTTPLSHTEVLAVVSAAANKMRQLLAATVKLLHA